MHLEFRLKMHLGSILKMIRLLILLIDISTGHWDYNATKFITFCATEFFMVLWKFINPRWIWMCIKLLCYSTLDLYNFKGVRIVWTSVKIFRLFILSKLIFPLKFLTIIESYLILKNCLWINCENISDCGNSEWPIFRKSYF